MGVPFEWPLDEWPTCGSEARSGVAHRTSNPGTSQSLPWIITSLSRACSPSSTDRDRGHRRPPHLVHLVHLVHHDHDHGHDAHAPMRMHASRCGLARTSSAIAEPASVRASRAGARLGVRRERVDLPRAFTHPNGECRRAPRRRAAPTMRRPFAALPWPRLARVAENSAIRHFVATPAPQSATKAHVGHRLRASATFVPPWSTSCNSALPRCGRILLRASVGCWRGLYRPGAAVRRDRLRRRR
jgi:hypothetical protein